MSLVNLILRTFISKYGNVIIFYMYQVLAVEERVFQVLEEALVEIFVEVASAMVMEEMEKVPG